MFDLIIAVRWGGRAGFLYDLPVIAEGPFAAI
jgi:hypothetical protein